MRPTSHLLSATRDNVRLGALRVAAHALSRYVNPRVAEPRRGLLIRPDHVGDVLLSAPAVALLRRALPRVELTYLVGPWAEEAARHGPPVDHVETFNFPGFTRRTKANALEPYVLLAQLSARVRSERYDLAVVLRPDHWWGALLALSAGIPVRVGTRVPETSRLLTHALPREASVPAAAQALGVARLALSALRKQWLDESDVRQFVVNDVDRVAAATILRRAGLEGETVVALHPSAGAPLKSWPSGSWARLADALTDSGAFVLLVGAPDDASLLRSISTCMASQVAVACGQSLPVSAALYERCALVVTVDSGAGHLAGAVGTPTVRLYGPAPPDVFGPWPARPDQRVLITNSLSCAPCGHLESPPCGAMSEPACMLALDVDAVVKAARASLNQG